MFYLSVGCQNKIKPEGQEQPAPSVFAAKSTTWFELFFVPVIPFDKKHIWLCGICQWRSPSGPGQWEPPLAYGGGFHTSQGYFSPNQPNNFQSGYQPGYMSPQNPQQK
ncbi:hypothetical protein V5O48_001798 [Marasmius crinis-equi]|uniref:Uncharacterized protein n=1 Tax=Marasmius crinis-equi TaxID=585013 RepID=A0ABR3FXF9_9AGAR